jgi:hypothetical protein
MQNIMRHRERYIKYLLKGKYMYIKGGIDILQSRIYVPGQSPESQKGFWLSPKEKNFLLVRKETLHQNIFP